MALERINLLLFIATGIVLLGVLLHGWPLLKDIRRNGWKPLPPKLGFVILLAGLALQFQLWAMMNAATYSLRMQAAGQIIAQETQNAALVSQIAPRRLTAEQMEKLGKEWAVYKDSHVIIVSYALDPEGAALAMQFNTVLQNAGATVESHIGQGTPTGNYSVGVILTAQDVDSAVRLAQPLHDIAGLDVLVDDKNLKAGPYILVGIKPVKP